MPWVVLSYSLPSRAGSTARVTLWRRLRRLGAVSPKAGVYVLPDRDECVEAFQWMAREVEHARGDALLMRVDRFDGLDDARLVKLFQDARARDYRAVEASTVRLQRSIAARRPRRARDVAQAREALARLRRSYAEVVRVDFFDNPVRPRVEARLGDLDRRLSPAPLGEPRVGAVSRDAYRGRKWVTRPSPHVDRLACAWLIRRFIDPDAVIRYAAAPEPGEVPFDMTEGEFGHRGNRCTFETMVEAFGLDAPGLRWIAEIVHEIDLRDGRYARPEAVGVDAILKGWSALPDREKEAHGIALFQGLYETFSRTTGAAPRRRP
jgi:hypothetical protein